MFEKKHSGHGAEDRWSGEQRDEGESPGEKRCRAERPRRWESYPAQLLGVRPGGGWVPSWDDQKAES